MWTHTLICDVLHLTFIGLRLFGESYSGLEYDYKGLCNVYELLNDTDNYLRYSQILETWRMIRERNLEVISVLLIARYSRFKFKIVKSFQVSSSYNESKEEITLDEVREKFFQLCSQSAVAIDTSSANRIE